MHNHWRKKCSPLHLKSPGTPPRSIRAAATSADPASRAPWGRSLGGRAGLARRLGTGELRVAGARRRGPPGPRSSGQAAGAGSDQIRPGPRACGLPSSQPSQPPGRWPCGSKGSPPEKHPQERSLRLELLECSIWNLQKAPSTILREGQVQTDSGNSHSPTGAPASPRAPAASIPAVSTPTPVPMPRGVCSWTPLAGPRHTGQTLASAWAVGSRARLAEGGALGSRDRSYGI